jgi:hypothetical protein
MKSIIPGNAEYSQECNTDFYYNFDMIVAEVNPEGGTDLQVGVI